MVGSTIPLNQLQGTGLTITKEGRVTNANTGLYTVPAGKKALVVSITGVIDALGGDASAAVAIKRGANFRPVGVMAVVDAVSIFNGQMLLQAGDIITNVGDSGATNTTIDMTATIQEFSV